MLSRSPQVRLNRTRYLGGRPLAPGNRISEHLDVVTACDGKQALIGEIDSPNSILIATVASQHRREFRPPQWRQELPSFGLPRVQLGDGGSVAIDDQKSDRFVEQAAQSLFIPSSSSSFHFPR